jgi:transcriptional regulator with XRE-family HTH domain
MATSSDNRIRELRKALQLSRAERADRAGLTVRGLRLIEIGEHNPRLSTAKKIAKALGTKLTVVFPEAGDE